MDKKEELMKKMVTLLQEIEEAVKIVDDRKVVYLAKYKKIWKM